MLLKDHSELGDVFYMIYIVIIDDDDIIDYRTSWGFLLKYITLDDSRLIIQS